MISVTTEFRGPALAIERFFHPAHCVHADPESEPTEFSAVTLIEQGVFALRQGRERWRFSRGDVLVSTPGLRRSYHHFRECPDDVCLTLAFAPDSVEDALGRAPSRGGPPRIAAGPRTEFGFRWVMGALRSSDPLAIECAAFHCAAVLGPHSWERMATLSGVGTYTRAVREACQTMVERLEEPHSLASLAREAGMSTFRFARVFSELAGEPPHQYLLRARLRYAASLLRQGASVTETALKSGFPNISHFSRTFHRRYGMPPTEYPS